MIKSKNNGGDLLLYFVLLLEGVLTFISPCILPLMPIYIAYFVGDSTSENRTTQKMVKEALLFVLGFSIVFILMGLFIASIGTWLVAYQRWINIVSGLIVILFGLDMLMDNRFLSKIRPMQVHSQSGGSSFLLGITFAVSWTPCVGTFLASVYSLILNSHSYGQAAIMLVIYCIGLGIPFVLSAVLISELSIVFDWIKYKQRSIQIGSGIALVVLGILMMTGHIARWLVLLS